MSARTLLPTIDVFNASDNRATFLPRFLDFDSILPKSSDNFVEDKSALPNDDFIVSVNELISPMLDDISLYAVLMVSKVSDSPLLLSAVVATASAKD